MRWPWAIPIVMLVAGALAALIYDPAPPSYEELFGELNLALVSPPASSRARFDALPPGAAPIHGDYIFPAPQSGFGGFSAPYRRQDGATCIGFPRETQGMDVMRCRFVVRGRDVEVFTSGQNEFLHGIVVWHGSSSDDLPRLLRQLAAEIITPGEGAQLHIVGASEDAIYGELEERPNRDAPDYYMTSFVWRLDRERFVGVASAAQPSWNPSVDAPTPIEPYVDPNHWEVVTQEDAELAEIERLGTQGVAVGHTIPHSEPALPSIAMRAGWQVTDQTHCTAVPRKGSGRLRRMDVAFCMVAKDKRRVHFIMRATGLKGYVVAHGFDGSPRQIARELFESEMALESLGTHQGMSYGKGPWWQRPDGALVVARFFVNPGGVAPAPNWLRAGGE